MASLIALAATSLSAAAAFAAIIGVASVAIRREEKNHTLTSAPTSRLTQAGRRLNGVYVRAPGHTVPRDPQTTPALPSRPARRRSHAPITIVSHVPASARVQRQPASVGRHNAR